MFHKLVLFTCIAFLTSHCTSQYTQSNKTTPTSPVKTQTAVPSKKENVSSITLEEITRGRQNVYTYTPTSHQLDKNGERKTKTMAAPTWTAISTAVNALTLSAIDTYTGPTQQRFYDGALASTLTLTVNGVTYTSQTFDENEPPKELEKLYWLLKKANQ